MTTTLGIIELELKTAASAVVVRVRRVESSSGLYAALVEQLADDDSAAERGRLRWAARPVEAERGMFDLAPTA